MSAEFCLDANVLITAWNVTYPPHIFGPLWEQIARRAPRIAILNVINNEIDPISREHRKLPQTRLKELHPLRIWLEKTPFQVPTADKQAALLSLELEKEYQIQPVSKGVSQNDIAMIAFAAVQNLTVVTLEGEQRQRPQRKWQAKIPLVCSDKKIPCITFVALLEQLQIEL